MTNFKTNIEFAYSLDNLDELRSFKKEFFIPKGKDGKSCIYLNGNSLGLQPRKTREIIDQELQDWARLGVRGHFESSTPWTDYHQLLTKKMAKIVGAKPIETVIMNTLTANLHFLMISFYNPTKKRNKILIESDAFTSDRYAVESQIRLHGFDPKKCIIEWSPKTGEKLLKMDHLEDILEKKGDEIELLLIGGVNYYTGQYLNLKKIADLGHSKGCKIGIDLAHGAGNIKPELHKSGVDFAAWCTYKYLNSGPGNLGGVFVHERHAYDKSLKRLTGWWGQEKSNRFKMREPLHIIPGAEGWQVSNPPIISMAAIKASLDLFDMAGMDALRKKSVFLTDYLEFLILNLDNENIEIISPKKSDQRGCQLSILIKNSDKYLHKKLLKNNIITDWRDPGVIRCAPVPMYNSFEDIYNFSVILKTLLSKN